MSYQHQHLGWGHWRQAGLTAALSLGLLSSGVAAIAAAEPAAAAEPISTESVANPAATAPNEVNETAPATRPLRIVLRIDERRVYLTEGDRILNSYPVAVGAAATPTPQGQFEVSKLIIEPVWQSPWTGEMHAPGPNSALGLRWIGFHTSESGSFGFHGTPTLDSVGKAVSNGCVRMYNEDVVALFSQVRIGTPVIVEP